jgi:hypothetical protein
LVGTIVYIPYSRSAAGPSGGSPIGLTYAIIGSAMMVFAMLLSLRKKLPTLRAGRLSAWMRGHIWLGLLSFPIILFHSGLAFGGALTTALMILFTIVTLSGIVGLVLQQFLPTIMMETVPVEVTFELADSHIAEFQKRAAERIEELKDPVPVLMDFYETEVKKFLISGRSAGGALSTEARADAAFQRLRKLLPPSCEAALTDIHEQVERRRWLSKQLRLHYILHGWLFVHVPLSAALMTLALAHAVMALLFT